MRLITNQVMRQSAVAALCALAAGSASAAATVNFVEPERFTDLPFSHVERERVLKELRGHFDKLAAKLPAGQELKVEVLDVDLAGITRPTMSQPELRILNGGADWPKMHFRYTIEQGGQVLKSGEAKLSDMTYMQNINRYSSGTSLRYEKHMLDDWFREKGD